MTKTNKQIMNELTDLFLQSDPKEVARALANLILDYHRLKTFDSLPMSEQLSLIERMDKNEKEFIRFVKKGPRKGEKFTTVNMNSDEL